MTAQLRALLAHAFDVSADDRRSLAERLGEADGPAKVLLANEAALRAGWEIAHGSSEDRYAFQQAVARHDLDREPSAAHKALARLIHAGPIRYLISFNWDTAIERAYEQLFDFQCRPGCWLNRTGTRRVPRSPGSCRTRTRSSPRTSPRGWLS